MKKRAQLEGDFARVNARECLRARRKHNVRDAMFVSALALGALIAIVAAVNC